MTYASGCGTCVVCESECSTTVPSCITAAVDVLILRYTLRNSVRRPPAAVMQARHKHSHSQILDLCMSYANNQVSWSLQAAQRLQQAALISVGEDLCACGEPLCTKCKVRRSVAALQIWAARCCDTEPSENDIELLSSAVRCDCVAAVF